MTERYMWGKEIAEELAPEWSPEQIARMERPAAPLKINRIPPAPEDNRPRCPIHGEVLFEEDHGRGRVTFFCLELGCTYEAYCT